MLRNWRDSEEEIRAAVAQSESAAEALRRLGLRAAGGNFRTLRRWVERWQIPTEHFDPYAAARRPRRRFALEEVLVEHSTYNRSNLKQRLYDEGLRERRCSLCGQGESWHGRRISLILDHVNGVFDDNRLENLRIVCPNCAATLETHCARNRRTDVPPKPCARCAVEFVPRYQHQRYCSRSCGVRVSGHARRKVDRPPYETLAAEVAATSYCAVARKYGVSDNAIRKWLRAYEREVGAAHLEARSTMLR